MPNEVFHGFPQSHLTTDGMVTLQEPVNTFFHILFNLSFWFILLVYDTYLII